MGNNHQKQEQLAPYQPQLIDYTLIHTYSPLSVYRHIYNSQQIMEHKEIIFHSQDIDRKLQTFYARYQHIYLVSTVYLKLEDANTCSDGSFQIRTFYERVVTNMSKVNDIPFNDSLHCYAVALKGFELLYKSYGYFQVFQNMFHICQKGKLKVWCNQHIYKSVPEQYLLGNGNEQDMVLKIISILDQNTQEAGKTVSIKDILVRTDSLTFVRANAKLKQICRQNKFYISQYLQSLQNAAQIQSILDIYVPYDLRNKHMKAFDTGLTFNPKNKSKNNELQPTSQTSVLNGMDSSRRNKLVVPSLKGRSLDQHRQGGRHTKKVTMTINNPNNPDGFPKFMSKSLQSSRKSMDGKDNSLLRGSSINKLARPGSALQHRQIQPVQKQINLNVFRNSDSNNTKLKKKTSRQNGYIADKVLYESKIDEQMQFKYSPPSVINRFSQSNNKIYNQINSTNHQNNRINHHISLGNKYQIQNQQINQQRQGLTRAYSQNDLHRNNKSHGINQVTTSYKNPPSHPFLFKSPPIYRNGAQTAAPNVPSMTQNYHYSLQPQTFNNHAPVYPIYPVQKVTFQTQMPSSNLKKVTKIQPTTVFSQNQIHLQPYQPQQHQYQYQIQQQQQHQQHHQQQSQQYYNANPQIIYRPATPTSNQIPKSQHWSPQNNYNKTINQSSNNQHNIYPSNSNPQNHYNNAIQSKVRVIPQVKYIQQRHNYQIQNYQHTPVNRQQFINNTPIINKRSESLPNKFNYIENTTITPKQQNTPQISKNFINSLSKKQSLKLTESNPRLIALGNSSSNQKELPAKYQQTNDKFQLPQLESKIYLLQSFADNKINTQQFLSNQSHALSNVKWQKGSNSGRDSISSAFRKQLLIENPSDKRPSQFSQNKEEAYQKKQVNSLDKFNYDHLQTDPKLLQLIRSVNQEYKSQVGRGNLVQDKYGRLTVEYSKKDAIKEIYPQQKSYNGSNTQSRFKKIATQKYQAVNNQQNYHKTTKMKVEQPKFYTSIGNLDSGAFKKKPEPFISNKFSAIIEKQQQQNVCSTSNGSIGKNYLQNLDNDILQDMVAYGIQHGKGRHR